MTDSELSPEEPRREGSPHARVNEAYRARMLAVARELVREQGYRGLDVDEVVTRAKVSRRTFHELLETREACFVLVLEETVTRVAAIVRDACDAAAPGGAEGAAHDVAGFGSSRRQVPSKRYVAVSRTALNQRRQPARWFHRSAKRPLGLSRKKT